MGSRHYTGEIASPFKRTIANAGWLAVPPADLTERDLQWIRRFESVSQKLASRFNQDIISFNRESEPLWRSMIADHPALFQQSGFRPGLFRLYATEEKFVRAQLSEKAIGSLKRVLDPGEAVKELPALRDAAEAGSIAGAMEVTGFSVNIHGLVDHLIRYLSSRGVEFHWQAEIDAIERDDAGRVKGLKADSRSIRASHYVWSTGAYSQELLAGFASAQAIAPIIGLWLMIPNSTPYLDRPLKISRAGFASDGAAEGANVVPGLDDEGRAVIHVSSGHGYIGFGNEAKLYRDIAELGRAVEETARDFFPRNASAAAALWSTEPSERRACVRPWTATGLGIFESTETDREGCFIITGGHNTGGFAQAPAVAMAVLASIERRSHSMHMLYHPTRLEQDLSDASLLSGHRVDESQET